MVAVLWLAFATQVVVNRVFHDSFKITEAFVKTNAEEMKSSIEVIAEYDVGFISEDDKKNAIQSLADAIGLKIESEISLRQEGVRTEYYFIKEARQATSEIKVVSVEQEKDSSIRMKHYIIVRLCISDSIQSIDRYKNIIEDTLADLDVGSKQITMQYEGQYKGILSTEEKNQIVELLVKELQGETSLEYEEEDLCTVYAYTGLIHEYIVSMGYKVNIQIAFSYNELTNKTKVTLATPILNGSW
jgi:hypothetical protein